MNEPGGPRDQIPSISISSGLKGTREWDAAAGGTPLKFALAGLKLKLPGGTEHEISTAMVHWSLEDGIALDIVAPPTRPAALSSPRTAGVRLEAGNRHEIHGILAGGVRASSGGYVIPESAEDEYAIPRWTRTIEGERLRRLRPLTCGNRRSPCEAG